MRRQIAGRANPAGFMICEGWVWVRSKDFFSHKPKKINIVKELVETLFSIGILFLWALIVYCSRLELSMVRLMACLVVYLVYVFKSALDVFRRCCFYKTGRQWHSCEHKVVNLLSKNLGPTLENLKNASSLHSRCGSQDYFKRLVFGLAVCSLLIFTGINLLVVLGIGAGIWFVLELISIKVIFPTQYFMLKEPTPAQYEEVERVGWEFLRKTNKLRSIEG